MWLTARARLFILLTALFVFSAIAGLGIYPRFANLQFDTALRQGQLVVTAIAPRSPEAAAGLRSGMELRSINGRAVTTPDRVSSSEFEWLGGGFQVRLEVATGSGLRTISYVAAPQGLPLARFVFLAILALYFFCGIYILAQRWRSAGAFWFGWTMTLIGLLECQSAVPRCFALWNHAGSVKRIPELAALVAVALILPAVIYCIFRAMGYMFSSQGSWQPTRWARAYLALLVFTAVMNEATYIDRALRFTALDLQSVALALVGVCFLIVLFGARLLYCCPDGFSPDVRSRRLMNALRWAAWISFLPPIAADSARAFVSLSAHPLLASAADWSALTLGIYPIVVAWAISRHRLFGFQGLLRRSLQYAFLSGGLGVAYFVPLVVFAVIIGSAGSRTTWLVIGIAGMAATIVGGRLSRRRLHQALDRRFFREAYESEQVLGGLGAQLNRYLDREALESYVLAQVDAALHLRWTAIYTSEAPAAAAVRGQFRVVAAGRFTASAPPPDRLDPPPEAAGAAAGDAPLVYQVQAVALAKDRSEPPWNGAELAVALRSQDHWLGWMLLGAKLSEEPFSKRDLGLLAAVAGQLAAALANVGLVAEVRKRDRIGQELTLAREVQKRLLPQELPCLPKLDIAVDYAPAREVGGDYYDVFEIEPGVLTLVVADVAGKGFSAALLMANLQALVRAQARLGALADRVARMNLQLSRSLAPGQFATMFLAELDANRGQLTYCNAGHEPPLLRRREDSVTQAVAAIHAAGRGALAVQTQPALLAAGGIPLGLFPEAQYEAEVLPFAAGDLLLVFTDGATDAMNPSEDSFGRERLESELAQGLAAGWDAARLVRHLRSQIEAFTAERAQFDDLTLLAVRHL